MLGIWEGVQSFQNYFSDENKEDPNNYETEVAHLDNNFMPKGRFVREFVSIGAYVYGKHTGIQ